ncbi:hypothetical protein A2U01_0077967, partial [Trifolium medium]|nr:hypothetical protein [Trifolium medium]
LKKSSEVTPEVKVSKVVIPDVVEKME